MRLGGTTLLESGLERAGSRGFGIAALLLLVSLSSLSSPSKLTLFVLFATFLLQPFLRNPSSNQVITYDDPDSLSLKGQFVKQSAMAGVNVWEISGDDNGSSPPSPLNSQL